VTHEWAGTRAGQAGYLLVTVKENDGMPVVEFVPGDLPVLVMAHVLELCLKKIVVEESARMALLLKDSNGDVD